MLKAYWWRCKSCGWLKQYGDTAPSLCFNCGDMDTWMKEKEVEEAEDERVGKRDEA